MFDLHLFENEVLIEVGGSSFFSFATPLYTDGQR